jgi:radical SAM superfamily enzyme YgiQ (UPF0313 family)
MAKKKVLIISANECSKAPFYPIYPTGELYIAKQLESKFQVRIMNLEFYNISKFQRDFKQFQADITLFSVRNKINITPKLRSAVMYVKKQKKPFFVGGTAVTLFRKFAEEYLKIPPKQIISGEFESMMHQIFPGIPNANNIEKVSMPDGSFLNYTEKELINRDREFGIECKRGCPFDCIYCGNHLFSGKKIRKRKISTVVKNICDLYSHGISNFFFVDAIFNYPRNYSYGVCVALSKKNLPRANFNAFIYPSNIGSRECEIWKKINLRITLGADGLSEKSLRGWNKPFTHKELLSSLKILKKNGMNYVLSLMLGGPGQTISDIKKELNFLEKINPPRASIVVGACSNPELDAIAGEKNKKDLPEGVFISPLVNIKELNKYINSKRNLYEKRKWSVVNLTKKIIKKQE